MKRTILASALVAAALVPATASAASPAQVCAGPDSIFGTPVSQGACVSSVALGKLSTAAYVANCKALEPMLAQANGTGRPYPYTFYGDVPSTELPPGWPKITVRNRAGCVAALRVYHGLFGG